MSKVPEFWQKKYREEAGKSWNLFYKRNEARFFKDRHWISREFPELLEPTVKTVLEVGCGVGNFALPLLQETGANLDHLYACDFSQKAIEILQQDERWNSSAKCTAFEANLSLPGDLLKAVPSKSIDVVTSIFVLSALPPENFPVALHNITGVLKDGGLWLFRDYAICDAAQQRFKEDRKLGEALYVRQDGTLSYFFDKGINVPFCMQP